MVGSLSPFCPEAQLPLLSSVSVNVDVKNQEKIHHGKESNIQETESKGHHADQSEGEGVFSHKERRRTAYMNAAFDALRRCLPDIPPDTKVGYLSFVCFSSSVRLLNHTPHRFVNRSPSTFLDAPERLYKSVCSSVRLYTRMYGEARPVRHVTCQYSYSSIKKR